MADVEVFLGTPAQVVDNVNEHIALVGRAKQARFEFCKIDENTLQISINWQNMTGKPPRYLLATRIADDWDVQWSLIHPTICFNNVVWYFGVKK